MGREENIQIVESYFQALTDSDVEKYQSLFADDVLHNVCGDMAISGCWEGKSALFDVLSTYFFERLDMERTQLPTKYEIMCADDDRVVGLMKADAYSVDGNPYPQTYAMIFTIRNGLIAEMYEFFDTALAETALFGATLERPDVEPMVTRPFNF
ncbi:MAG: nuclear transport factor 2 family protein [Acidimicrobiales bacterium]|jgi:ketosteroid isomerase-like protein|nr:nuclear transport factor 2 family protein [Acidimicrobiales bacterium]MDG1845124.1 nuclear transport factor 2 family protein [Acidimicrobiales bacterium]